MSKKMKDIQTTDDIENRLAKYFMDKLEVYFKDSIEQLILIRQDLHAIKKQIGCYDKVK